MRRLLVLLVPLALLAQPATAVGGPGPAGMWPTGGPVQVVRGFDPPPQPWLSGHRGVDLLVVADQPILAPIDGVVAVAGRIVDRPVLVVRSGPIAVSLEPVRPTVGVGAPVAAGDVIGQVAEGPGHCPPYQCLHLGLRVEGVYHDPLLLLVAHRPVLLPNTG